MEITPEDLGVMLAKAAEEAVNATYRAIAEREQQAADEAAGREVAERLATEERRRAAEEAAAAEQQAAEQDQVYYLFGALSVAILVAAALEQQAYEQRDVRMAMFDESGKYLGVCAGRADLIQKPPAEDWPEWAKPEPVTYVEWRPEFDELHRQATAASMFPDAPPMTVT